MRNLSRLTNAANRIENGPRQYDARRAPRCKTEGCRRAALWLGGDKHGEHCHEHATPEERQTYYAAWKVGR